MNNSAGHKVALIALIVGTAIGYGVNEYRHQLLAHNQAPATAMNAAANQQLAAPQIAKPQIAEPIVSAETQSNSITRTTAAISSEQQDWAYILELFNNGQFFETIQRLQAYLQLHHQFAPGWQMLAIAYNKHGEHEASLEAWFHYLDCETDAEKIEQAITIIKQQLANLYQQPDLLGTNRLWLTEKINQLLSLSGDDGQLHLMAAALYLKTTDNYQAQYHAIMATMDPATKSAAEKILAAIDDANLPDKLAIPLIKFGNQFLTEVRINGHTARLLLDTGASVSGVTQQFVDKFPDIVKKTKPIELHTASGIENSILFAADTIALDQLQFNQHFLALLPMASAKDFDGLLGLDILGKFDFVIDQDNAQLRLSKRVNN